MGHYQLTKLGVFQLFLKFRKIYLNFLATFFLYQLFFSRPCQLLKIGQNMRNIVLFIVL